MLGAFAVGAEFYARYHAYVQIERQQSDRVEILKRLGAFIAEGRGLLGQIKDAGVELPAAAADTWAQRVEIFLRDRLGEPPLPASASRPAKCTAPTPASPRRGWPIGARCAIASSTSKRSPPNSPSGPGGAEQKGRPIP